MKRLLIMIGIFLSLTMPAFSETLSSWEDIEKIFSQARENQSREITFRVDRSILSEIQADSIQLNIHAGKAGVRNLSFSYWTDGKIEVKQMEYFKGPYPSVRNTAEMVNAVQQMRYSGEDQFALLLEPELYETVQKDPDLRRSILLKGGLVHSRLAYHTDELYRLEYEDCSYWNGVVLEVSDLTGLPEKIQEIGSRGYDAFALLPSKELFERLTGQENELLHALETAAFVNSGVTTYQGERSLIYYKEGTSVFFPGYVILRAAQLGQEALLPERLQETLRMARRMIAEISGTQEDTVLAIHDLLCRHTAYKIDESTEEDDCCIGAILNGEANCDGYADAFFLLCGLKEVPVRMVSGEVLKQLDPGEDPFHVWNLVQLNGLWQGVDVTWDDPDRGDEITYGQYLMGMDMMEENYIFRHEFLPSAVLKVTSTDKRPVPEFSVSTADEAISALKRAVGEGKTSAILLMSESLFRKYASEKNPVWKWLDLAGISGNIGYVAEERKVFVSDISVLSGIVVLEVDTQKELVSELRQVNQRSAREVRVYCSDALFAEYLSDQQQIWTWLRDAGFSNASVSYSTDRKMLVFSDF